MKKILRLTALLFFSLMLFSCGSSKKMVSKVAETPPDVKLKTTPKLEPADKRVFQVISNAKDYLGTKYKYGGTSKRGMDCSGLIYTSFLDADINLPRISRNMALQGERLHLNEVRKGDLLFFQTNKNRNVINHVGLVIDVIPDQIIFIHSTTSRGVVISSLSESYWFHNFVMARRIL